MYRSCLNDTFVVTSFPSSSSTTAYLDLPHWMQCVVFSCSFQKQHAIVLASINLLVVHAKTSYELLAMVQVLRHVMIRWADINNQFHKTVVTIVGEGVL
jgi:hypothetical protein